MYNQRVFNQFYGKVTDNEDPDNLGRVKVFLEILGDNIETNWIPVISSYASPECSCFFIPEVDDQVVVGFLWGNPEYGLVLGGVWTEAEEQKPPETGENTGSDLNKDGENNLGFIKTKSGHQMILDDKDGEETIQIIAKDGATRYEFLASDEVSNFNTDVDLKLNAQRQLLVEAEEGEIKFEKGVSIKTNGLSLETASKDIKIEAKQSMSIKGSNIKLN